MECTLNVCRFVCIEVAALAVALFRCFRDIHLAASCFVFASAILKISVTYSSCSRCSFAREQGFILALYKSYCTGPTVG